jgi:hypothetical protein
VSPAVALPPRRCTGTLLLQDDKLVDERLVAADVTLIFAFGFARTLSVVLLSPDFPGWLAPIETDVGRLSTTLNFAGEWSLAWFAAGLACDTFAPGIDEESMRRVGPVGAGRCFLLAATGLLAVALFADIATPGLPPPALQITVENVAASLGIGLALVAWRELVASLTDPWR